MPKTSIRLQFLAERRARPTADCVALSTEIQQRFVATKLFQEAGCLALYSAIHNEVLTDRVARRALELGKTLTYPRVKGGGLEFVPVAEPDDLDKGAFGILEPQGRAVMPIGALDLIVIPGVAFDLSGHRLGYGRGFYDRALAACRSDCVKVGFAYETQLVAGLPVAQHDERLSVLITENRTLYFAA